MMIGVARLTAALERGRCISGPWGQVAYRLSPTRYAVAHHGKIELAETARGAIEIVDHMGSVDEWAVVTEEAMS